MLFSKIKIKKISYIIIIILFFITLTLAIVKPNFTSKLAQSLSKSKAALITKNHSIPKNTNNNYHFTHHIQKIRTQETPINVNENFLLGWYHRIDKLEPIDPIANVGVNLIMAYSNDFAKRDNNKIKAYLDAAEKAKIKILLEPYRDDILSEDIAAVTEFVHLFKEHPALFGWYLYDEPVLNNVPIQNLENFYRVIKAEAPDKPIVLNFSGKNSKQIPKYRSAFDICMINRYPLLKKYPNNSKPFLWFSQGLKESLLYTKDTPCWIVIQAFENTKWRLPTKDEERYMIYSVITAGYNGLFLFAYHRVPQEWLDSVAIPLIQELQNYLPAIEKGQLYEKVRSNNKKLETYLYQQADNKGYILIAINHQDKEATYRIEIDPTIEVNSIISLEKNKNIYFRKGNFNDNFAPHAVGVYKVL